jgi:hypothetical protein
MPQLWATVGFAFNVSVACTSVSSRIKKSYDVLLEPLDQVRTLRQCYLPINCQSTHKELCACLAFWIQTLGSQICDYQQWGAQQCACRLETSPMQHLMAEGHASCRPSGVMAVQCNAADAGAIAAA